MVEFKTLKSERIDFGRNDFIEVARKKTENTGKTTEFVSIARGYYAQDNTPRYRKAFTVPDDEEVMHFISKMLLEM